MILVLLLLLLVSISAVSAVDDANETISSDESIIEVVTSDSTDVLTSDGQIDGNLASNSHTVNKTNYASYFNSVTGELVSSSVNNGDTIYLEGDFQGANFVFDKSINIVGINNDMKKCTVTLKSGASGSSISNLKIANSQQYSYGIFLNGASNCIVQGCFINNTGASSYSICLGNNANNNNITDNSFNNYGITYGHGTRSTTPVLISGSHYNYIANNDITCDDANGIYLSSYDGGPLNGGLSNFNIIYNNTLKYNVLPTSWSYGIQLMGGNNTVDSNKIIGAYRGISSSGSGNIIINNKIINLTGADYSNPNVELGGDVAIVGSYYNTIINNTIENAKLMSTGSGISALDNCIVKNNVVQIVAKGIGIHPQGSNILIENNNISTVTGPAILFDSFSFNLTVSGNNISSTSAVGILIQKLSSKKMPGNITIINNYVRAGNENVYAIDARGADNSTNNVIEGNRIPKGYGKVATPEGEFDPTKPMYKFNGTVYTITPDNINDYIEEDGKFKVFIKDGDIINFEGDFNLNSAIIVNAALKINGKDARFYNTTFKVYNNGVWLENLFIRNNHSSRLNAWGVLVYRVFGATVRNCDIDVYDRNAAYAVYVVESSDVDVINNTLSSKGDYLTYTLLAHTVEDCRFINNTINTIGTGAIYVNGGGEVCIDGNESCLDGSENCIDGNENCIDGNENCIDGNENCIDGNENCIDGNENCIDGNENCIDGSESCIDGNCFDGNHVVTGIFRTYGILVLYSSGNEISGNKVNATSQLNTTFKTNQSTNSIVGIDLYYNCHDNVISNNDIYVKANDNYIYGMGVLGWMDNHDAPIGQGASNNKFINNNIYLEGSYFVEGIVIGDESETTIIRGNIVNAKSDNVAYGVNLEMSQESTVDKNNFTLNSDIVYGVEAIDSNNNVITNNNFELNAKQAYGLAFSNSKYNDIISNIIFANGTDEEITFKNFDSISGGNAGVYLKSYSCNNTLKENNITSAKGFAVIIDDVASGNIISDNYLDSENGIGDDAVNSTVGNIVDGNYKYLITGNLEDISFNYLENGTFIFTTDNPALNGAIVKFYDIDMIEIASIVLENGRAEFEYDFPNELPGNSAIYAVVSKKNYRPTEFNANLYIAPGNLIVVVDNVTGAIARNAKFTAIIKNILGQGVEGISAVFSVIDEGDSRYLGEAVSDENGLVTLVAIIPQVYDEHPIILVEIRNPFNFNPTAAESNLTAYKVSSTSIALNSNVYSNGVLATLKDQKGNLLSNKDVTIVIGGTTYNVKTNADGQITIPSLARGLYSVSVSFNGDDEYYSSKNTAKVTVKPAIIGNKNYSVFYGNTVKYTVRVMGPDGKYVDAGKVVTIKVNGQTYKVSTDVNGYATKSLKLKSGSYTITSEFNGDKVSNQITIKPTLTAKNIVKKKSKKIKFSAKLVNKNGKVLKNKKVTFKIKGKKYTAKTNKKGVATVTIKNLKVGKFKITSSYGGCSITNKITIK